jgi:hypothetical protein
MAAMFPSLRTGERAMSDNTINAARCGAWALPPTK